ncbi:MAG: PIN domain-containing protein [Myxococcales bacterium]|nr:PIN domain-containing protein [Myxococcales bacterium]
MPFLVDTHVLVYRYDGRFPDKQRVATALLRDGLTSGEAWLSHQAVLEMVAALTRSRGGEAPLMARDEAGREAEELLHQFRVLYPDEEVLRLAIRGWATYQLSWFDAHMWATAERFGFDTLCSEDFQHQRIYGSVRVIDPFASI